MRISAAGFTCVAVLSTFGTGALPAQSASDGGACSRTARAARKACGHDVTNNYLIAVGRCLNTSDAAERDACLAEARDARTEATQLCSQQFEARDDLCDLLGEAPYDPSFDPADFVDPLQIGKSVTPNRFLPLVPGSQWVYRSPSETNIIDVVGKVERVEGVPCTVVHDVVKQNGQTTEDTIDLFAQRVDGSVWYCGEMTQEMENGRVVNVEGSWRAGEDNARPGIIMEASPQVGDTYRQEFLLGDAEDAATVRTVTGSATVPAASCSKTCLITPEFTALEPDLHEDKYYAPNIGMILQIDHATGERLELIRYRIP
jgi:hypothetical protein